MRCGATTWIALLAAAALAGVSAAGAGGASGRRITVTSFGEMAPVVFDHTRHAQDLGCDTCHHPKGTREGAHRCGACHGPKAEGKAIRFEDAAHKENVGKCWACHLGPKAKKKLDCDDCHSG
jgi:hypothetical protein